MPVKFRKSMDILIEEYRNNGGLKAFYYQYRSSPDVKDKSTVAALNDISETIRKGPVVYSGGASGENIFGYDSRLKNVTFPSDIWNELSLMGHWIRDALILRWA